jgi:hypothetical protein
MAPICTKIQEVFILWIHEPPHPMLYSHHQVYLPHYLQSEQHRSPVSLPGRKDHALLVPLFDPNLRFTFEEGILGGVAPPKDR